MSRRDWYFVGGFLAVVVVLVAIFNNRSEPEASQPAGTATTTPTRTSDVDQEALEAFLATPREEGAMHFGFIEGSELGSKRTLLTRASIQDAILRYEEDLKVAPIDIKESCDALDADTDGKGLQTLAVDLGAKRAYIAGLLLGYAGDAPGAVIEFCNNYEERSA